MDARAVIKAAIAQTEILEECYAAIPKRYLKHRLPTEILLTDGEFAYKVTVTPIVARKPRKKSDAKSKWLR